VVIVDQYQPGTSLNIPMIVGQIPFSRHLLENKLGLQESTHRTLLAIEARQGLGGIQRGDLVLIDRKQTGLIEDGIYLLNRPGLVLKEISVFPNNWILVTGSAAEPKAKESAKPTVLRKNYRRGLNRAKLQPNLKGEVQRTSVDHEIPPAWAEPRGRFAALSGP